MVKKIAPWVLVGGLLVPASAAAEIGGLPDTGLEDSASFNDALEVERDGTKVRLVLKGGKINVKSAECPDCEGEHGADKFFVAIYERDPAAARVRGEPTEQTNLEFDADGKLEVPAWAANADGNGKFSGHLYFKPGVELDSGKKLPGDKVFIAGETYVSSSVGRRVSARGSRAPARASASARGRAAAGVRTPGRTPTRGAAGVRTPGRTPAVDPALEIDTDEVYRRRPWHRRLQGVVDFRGQLVDTESRDGENTIGFAGLGGGVAGLVGYQTYEGRLAGAVSGALFRRDFSVGDREEAMSIGSDSHLQYWNVGLTGAARGWKGRHGQLDLVVSPSLFGQTLDVNILDQNVEETARGVRLVGSVAMPRLFVNDPRALLGLRFSTDVEFATSVEQSVGDLDVDYGSQRRGQYQLDAEGSIALGNVLVLDGRVGLLLDENYSLRLQDDLGDAAVQDGNSFDFDGLTRDNVNGLQLPLAVRGSTALGYLGLNGIVPLSGDVNRWGVGLETGNRFGAIHLGYESVSADGFPEDGSDDRGTIDVILRFDETDLLDPIVKRLYRGTQADLR